VVQHGVTGLICDTPGELPAALREVTRLDPAACRARVAHEFSAEEMARGYERAYLVVLDADRAAEELDALGAADALDVVEALDPLGAVEAPDAQLAADGPGPHRAAEPATRPVTGRSRATLADLAELNPRQLEPRVAPRLASAAARRSKPPAGRPKVVGP
jgi:hypothetical protein